MPELTMTEHARVDVAQRLDLLDVITTSEVLEILDINNRPALAQPRTGIADKFDLRWLRLGGQRAYLLEDVLKVATEELMLDHKVTMARLGTVLSEADPWRTNYVDEFLDHEEALAILGYGTREALYQKADFRGGPIKTVLFGRVRLYWRHGVQEVVDARAR